MKILLIHNRYLIPGGEDEVVLAERKVLEDAGNEVILYERCNAEIERFWFIRKAAFLLKDMFWSQAAYREVVELVTARKPDIAHIHNPFFMMSPAVYQACCDKGVPVVQTLHNFRFLCPTGVFYRDGHVCEDCLQSGRGAAVRHRCWKDSFLLSFFLKQLVDRYHKTVLRRGLINKFIVLSEFSKQKYIANGFPAEKITVKPNFLNSGGNQRGAGGHYALFVGGFFPYKGVQTLLEAWQGLDGHFPLKVIGDGPLFKELTSSGRHSSIEFLGRKSFEETFGHIQKARFVIVPSECYENFPRVIVEAFACGVPVLASRIGGLPEIVEEQRTGLLFRAGEASDLAEKAKWLFEHPHEASYMGATAREVFQARYTSGKNYEQLMQIYQGAMA